MADKGTHPNSSERASQVSGDRGERKRFYATGAAARMLKLHPQTLRLYERLGLVKPRRDAHGKRMYGDEDIERVRKIQHLTQQMGVNLAGVEIILRLMERISELERELEQTKSSIDEQVKQRAKVLALQLLDWLRYQEHVKVGAALKMLAENPLVRACDWEALSKLFDQFVAHRRFKNKMSEA